ncbi:MBL fold metallo-hydrolase [Paenibacillus humicola]|uniref:MBL fold metallo-hydrolase n=1 Tax=Paenibacillus humicola TaxID=3110540 RepID=UPI00237B38E0|nr:MBL fold metallo-hydrolase [Paenibacillus humicola]
MKAERVSEHIWSLRTWIIIPIRVWIVVEEDGVVLVDAGIGAMARGILAFIDKLDAGPLKAIVLTHGHSDHTGSVKAILRNRQVPVYADGIELPYMEGEQPYPRRKKAVPFLPKGIARPLPEAGGEPAPFGSLTPFRTPGHSPGHVAYYHERDGVLLAGDLFTSKRGRLQRPMPMFTADMADAVRSGAIVKKLRPASVEICHGGPVLHPAEQYDAYARKAGTVNNGLSL